jgi:hypothetical protein
MIFRIIQQTVTNEVSALGGVSLKVPGPEVLSALSDFGIELPQSQFTALYRIQLRGTIFYSRQYGRVTKRNSYTVMYQDRTKQCKQYGAIDYFLYVRRGIVAVLEPLCPTPGSCRDHFDVNTGILDLHKFLHPVSFEDGCVVCLAEDIMNGCLFLDFDCAKYIVAFPSCMVFD